MQICENPEKPKAFKKYLGYLAMLLLALATGFVVGFCIWALFWFSGVCISAIWEFVPSLIGNPAWYPLLVCPVGGLIIGLYTKYLGGSPASLEEVIKSVKTSGEYRVENVPKSIGGFLLPLMFGGSVGPEAGLTGIIAAACSWLSSTLKFAGSKAKEIIQTSISAVLSAIFMAPLAGVVAASDDIKREDIKTFQFKKLAKIVLYAVAAAGAFAGVSLLSSLVHFSGGLPRFEVFYFDPRYLIWFLPCVLLAYVMSLVFLVAEKLFHKLAEHIKSTVLKPVLCGLVLGGLALLLPLVLFSGEEESLELMGTWQELGPAILLTTAFAKIIVSTLCLNFGWRGGHFFPCIFAGVSAGFGFASFLSIDPFFCVAVVSSAFLAGFMKKPILVIALLCLCFSIHGIVWIALAAFLANAIPFPKNIAEI